MRFLLAFVLLAIASLLLFLWWPDAGAAAPKGTTGHESTAATPPASAPENAAPGPAAASARQVVPEIFDGPTGNVRVVLFGSNTPVAGATVRYQPPDFDWQKLTPERTRELQVLVKDFEQFLQGIGRESVTDAEGRCTVPLGKHGTQVMARSGELYGQSYVSVEAEVQIALRPDHTLRVSVVDEGGQAAAGIALQARSAASPRPYQMGTTDANGRYDQAHVQLTAGDQSHLHVQLWAAPPGGAGPEVSVDLAAPPPEVILQLGLTGSVTVRNVDAAGQPIDPRFLDDCKVGIAGFDKLPDRDQEQAAFNGHEPTAELDARGIAWFPRVALGRYLMVNRDHFGVRKGFAGPTAATRQVEVLLQEPAEGAVLTGTLLGADGTPFSNRTFLIGGRTERSSGAQQHRTDEQGRMRCFLGTYVVGDAVVFTISNGHGPRDSAMSIELPPRRVQPGINDLGEVRLAADRVVLSGRLVCGDGVAVNQVQLEVERLQGRRWNQEWRLQHDCQTDGAFTIRGAIPEGEPLRLRVPKGPYLPVDRIECKAGTTGIEIPLRSAASATAVFLVDERTPIDRMQFHFRDPQAADTRDSRDRAMERHASMGRATAKDGRLQREWTGLTPGSYQLTVTCAGAAEPIVRIDAVAVTSGPCTDPRLTDIDLRTRAPSFEVRATDAFGQPVTSTEAFVVVRSPGNDWYGYHLGRGVVTLAAPSPLDLFVIAPGHRLAAVAAVREPQTIALERAENTSLRVELPAILPENTEFHLRLQPRLDLPRQARVTLDTGSGMSLDSLFAQDVVVGADGMATVMVRCPGEHAIEATVSTDNHGGSYIRDLVPKTMTLPAGAGTTVKVGAKGFEDALQRLRR